jgi:hypothetical protein
MILKWNAHLAIFSQPVQLIYFLTVRIENIQGRKDQCVGYGRRLHVSKPLETLPIHPASMFF